jgi:hypothetical protein
MACVAFRMNHEHVRAGREDESWMLRQLCVTLAAELMCDV